MKPLGYGCTRDRSWPIMDRLLEMDEKKKPVIAKCGDGFPRQYVSPPQLQRSALYAASSIRGELDTR